MIKNAALNIDGYKTSHPFQYPAKTGLVHSNYTARKSRLKNVHSIIFFGLQYWMKKDLIDNWNETFFNRPKDEVMAEIKGELDLYCPLPSYDHIAELHDLGYLPIEIMAVDEGTRVPIGVPCMTIHNTLPEFFWVTNMLETNLSNIMWMLINSATISAEYRKIFEKYAKLTCDDDSLVDFQGHDFSYRGMSGQEAAEMSGAAHLTSFKGTDTIPAVLMLRNYYNAEGFVGGSVPASEHSVQCANAVNGEFPDDAVYLEKMLDTYPSGMVSIVSDGFDFWKMIVETYPLFKERIMERDGKVIIRPDSGDPVKIVAGWTDYELNESRTAHLNWAESERTWREVLPEHTQKGLIECLWEIFGGTINDKGYKVLDPHIGAIYGDAITRERAEEILSRLEAKGFASNNIVFGIGSYTYQYNTRDTHGGAVKATYIEVDGKGQDIFKDPKTDDGTKKSMRGLLRVNADFSVDQGVSWEEMRSGLLTPKFLNGKIVAETNIEEIRERIKNA